MQCYKIMKLIGFLILLCSILGTANAQDKTLPTPKLGKNDTIRTFLVEYDGEMIPWMPLSEVAIRDARIFKTEADRKAFRLLKYNVYKVIPYAHFAGDRYRKLQRDLAMTGDKRKQKELMKQCEEDIKTKFAEVKNLTISQGEILIKLVDRETENSTYDLLKDMKGGLKAFMFQSVARIFGHNLKQKYDRDEQRDIEAILQEAGYDSQRN